MKYTAYIQQKLFFGFIFVVCILLIFQDAFRSYFFQDDWFSLLISQASSLKEFFTFFIPRTDVIYYRPLGMQVPFFLFQNLFGINPVPFRVATLVIHLGSTYLVYKLILHLLKNRFLSLFAAFIYAVSAVHQTIFYWAATFAFVMVPFWYFFAFYLHISGKEKGSFWIYCLGLLTNELMISFPLTLFAWQFIEKKKVTHWFRYYMVTILYVGARAILFTLPAKDHYSLTTSLSSIVRNYRNYFLWALNWPEEIGSQFTKLIFLSETFVNNFYKEILVFSTISFLFLGGLFILPLILVYKKKKFDQIYIRKILFGASWFILALIPVVILSEHSFSYYTPIALFGFLLVACSLYAYFLNLKIAGDAPKLLLLVIAISWLYGTYYSVQLNSKIHRAPQRAKIAEMLTEKIIDRYPTIPPNTVLIFPVADENKWALGNESALKVLYHDQSLGTFYGSWQDALKTYGYEKRYFIFK